MVLYESFTPLPPLSTEKKNFLQADELMIKEDPLSDSSSLLGSGLPVRQDGRQLEELRPISIRTGVIENADGSAFFSIGGTKVLCGIFGPNLCKQNTTEDGLSVSVEYTTGSFCKDSYLLKGKAVSESGEIKNSEKVKSILLEKVIHSVICHEKYKRSSIDCYIYVIDDDGSSFSAAISAACLSLCNAKIEIIGLFSATRIISVKKKHLFGEKHEGQLNDDYSLVIDPNNFEISVLEDNFSSLEIGLCTIRNQVVYLSAKGEFFNDPKRIEECFSLAEASCSAIVNEIKDHLLSET
ncbi:3' exoribonuclease family, domain 1 domain-containing protein [Cryptosporidium felis]|nr:3' exoribonuclease family, domain 1 domain-containing protein [Cryptosporidium felis]